MNKYQYKVQGIDYDVEIINVEGNIAKVNVNGINFEVEMKQPINPVTTMPHKPKVTTPVTHNEQSTTVVQTPNISKKEVSAGTGRKVTAPLPGTITEIKVKVRDTIKAGDTVIVLEAMKMQNNIEAETNGIVTSILVNKGDTVMEGDTLMTIG